MGLVLCISFSSCSGNSHPPFDSDDDNTENASSPQTINGETFECERLGKHELVNNFNFSSNSFTIDYGSQSYWISTSGTPSYTYTKTGKNTATLVMNYKQYCFLSSATNFTITFKTTLNLTFTTSDGGILSGKEQSTSYGNGIGSSIDSYTYTKEAFTMF